MKLIEVIVNGKIRRLSQTALDILGLEKIAEQNKPIAMRKLPPNLEILKIEKKAPEAEVTPTITEESVAVTPADPPVEVKKNEDVTVAKDTVKRRRRGTVGTKK
jgi:hypothetical protein